MLRFGGGLGKSQAMGPTPSPLVGGTLQRPTAGRSPGAAQQASEGSLTRVTEDICRGS